MKPATNERPREDLQDIKRRSLAGVGALFRRQVIIKASFFLGNIILARILSPNVFGIYDIVSFVVQFFSLVGDVGLGAALIRKHERPLDEELASTFWTQQVLVWTVALLVFVLAPMVVLIYPSLPPVGIWLIRAMAASLILMSLKTVPALLLERDLAYDRIARVDITENLSYQVAVVTLALLGFGVWSFILGALVRGIVGNVMIYSISPWRPSFQYRFEAVKEAMRFGIPFQANHVINFLKDAVTPLFVGAYAGATAVGYLAWARTLAFAPLIISASFERVAFPTFSKIQHDRELLKRAIERSMRSMTLLLFPVTAFLAALGPDIVRIVFTEKWMPGLGAFYLYCTSPFVIGVLLPMYSAILSLGKSPVLLKMSVLLACLEWGLGIPFVMQFGFTGMAMNQPVISTLFFFIYRNVLAAEGIILSVIDNIKWQLVIAMAMGTCVKLIAHNVMLNIVTAPILFVTSCMAYLLALQAVRPDIVHDFKENLLRVIGKRKD